MVATPEAPVRAPRASHVVLAIARRELRLALRRKFVRWLYVASGLPLIVIATILAVKTYGEQALGAPLPWDPVLAFFRAQAFPIALLALGLGTPLVAADRAEEVLFLYATRPVAPWHYTAGKLAAVVLPAAGLLVVPGLLFAILRVGMLPSEGIGSALALVGKVLVAGSLLAAALGGVAVGASALTRRARWALPVAIGAMVLPDALAQGFTGGSAPPLGTSLATERLLAALFESGTAGEVLWAGLVLVLWAAAGVTVTIARVGREMTP